MLGAEQRSEPEEFPSHNQISALNDWLLCSFSPFRSKPLLVIFSSVEEFRKYVISFRVIISDKFAPYSLLPFLIEVVKRKICLLFRFTNNILSTAQQIWLQKLGGAKNPVKALKDDVVMKEQLQMQKSMQEAITKENTTEAGEQSTSEGLRPGERLDSTGVYKL